MSSSSNEEIPPTGGQPPEGRPSSAPAGSRRRSRHLSLWIAIAAATLLLGGVWWLNHAHNRAAMGGGDIRRRFAALGPNAPVPVVVQAVQKGDIDVYLNGLGTVTPLANVTVRTRISGQLTEADFQEGQAVKAGDLLAVIDPRPYQVALEQAQGQLQQAQAQLAQARADLARYETLTRQDSIAVQQVDAQRALVNQYEGLVQSDQAAVDNAKLNLVYCHVTAPVTGRVGLRQVDAGNYVTPGDASGLVTLTQMKPISVIFTLPEDAYAKVAARLHAGANVPVDAFDSSQTEQLASGALAAVDNQADTSTGTFKLRATFANDDEKLFPNEFVNVRMLLDVERGVLVIPTSAIEQGQTGSYVYAVASGDTVKARPVALGATQGERVAVVSGLAAGDRLVVDGADRLRDGGHIVEQTAGAAPAAGAPAKGGPAGTEKWRGRQRAGAPSAAKGERPADRSS